MLETLKSIVFVIVTVMVALVLQAHAGKYATNSSLESADAPPMEQIQAYN